MDLSFDKNDVVSVLNVEEAHEYIGSRGYFSNTIYGLQNAVDVGFIETLKNVHDMSGKPFAYAFVKACHVCEQTSLFLPADKVKQTEKKWRPFTLQEFNAFFAVGDVITFRARKSNCTGKWLYQGYLRGYEDLSDIVYLGSAYYSLPILFDNYEYQEKSGNWNLFGVEE